MLCWNAYANTSSGLILKSSRLKRCKLLVAFAIAGSAHVVEIKCRMMNVSDAQERPGSEVSVILLTIVGVCDAQRGRD